MIINAPGFVPVLRQPGHARRDGAGAEKEEEKKTGSEVGEETLEKTAALERPPPESVL